MGLDVNGINFLLHAQRQGVSFVTTATIGRQMLLLSRTELKKWLRQFRFDIADEQVNHAFDHFGNYAEGFIEFLGAEEIVSFDASNYENASIVHDFNYPISDEFKNRFSVVLDGGTLEHIFNFPTAIKNCMEMLAVGGHFLAITPANNHLGHGFFQFSPELFFRIFSEQNGFELQQLMIFEETDGSQWYEVSDPVVVKERVTLINSHPTMLLIIAKKVKTVEIFSSMPQQSDYQAVWNHGDGLNLTPGKRRFANLPFRNIIRLPLDLFRRTKLSIGRRFGVLHNRKRHFKKINIP
ncbi:MAG: hypothetical protein ABIV48_08815 [Pyrinomonadaceae bacterium]